MRSAKSIHGALAEGVRALSGRSASAALDARVLLGHALARDHAWLLAHGDAPVEVDALARYRAMIARRERGVPVAYLTGRKEFWSLQLEVDNTVLVPRPETEHLVEHALALIPESGRHRIADLGTGSGAVALAVASERPCCEITATDISAEALDAAQRNAARLGITNVRFLRGDWFQPLEGRRYDVIVSNPPYVAAQDPCLEGEGTGHEPAQALRSGGDGLDAIRIIGGQAAHHLNVGGWLLLEHGSDQRSAVAGILARGGFDRVACHLDYSGRPRISAARKPPRVGLEAIG